MSGAPFSSNPRLLGRAVAPSRPPVSLRIIRAREGVRTAGIARHPIERVDMPIYSAHSFRELG